MGVGWSPQSPETRIGVFDWLVGREEPGWFVTERNIKYIADKKEMHSGLRGLVVSKTIKKKKLTYMSIFS